MRLISVFSLATLLASCAPVAMAPTASAPATPALAAPAFQSDRINVVTTGSGPDVVLVHGLSSSRDVWNTLVQAVPGYRYHLIQMNGFAGVAVDGNGGEGPFVAPVAEEIARYIREAKLDRPALVGHSMGGTMAMMVAARHPSLVSRVMIVDMIPFMASLAGPAGATAQSMQPIAEAMRARIASLGGKAMFPAMIATMVAPGPLRDKAVADASASDQGVVSRGMYDLLTTDLRPELGAIKVPMTVLYVHAPNSGVDAARTKVIYEQSFANAPQAKLVFVPDSLHFIMHDQPARFATEMKAFLGG